MKLTVKSNLNPLKTKQQKRYESRGGGENGKTQPTINRVPVDINVKYTLTN